MNERSLTEYDPEKFVVPARDDKGHKERVWVWMAPRLIGMLKTVVTRHKDKFPYSGVGELIRHAIVRHLHYLSKIEEDIKPMCSMLDMLLEVVTEEENAFKFMQVVERSSTLLLKLLNSGNPEDKQRAQKIYLSLLSQLRGFKDSYWKKHYRAAMEARLGTLLQNVSFTDFFDEEEAQQ